ncbi:hypothetical protein [Vibrio sp.]|uniref:hypothetical protein n=1 Tax=Vibrio sp. TaxID=678 RepID=UPI003D0D06F9
MMLPVRTTLALCLSVLMFGCAETPNEYINLKGKYADDYELDAEDYSEPTRFLHPLTWVEPERNANNLDKFYDDIDTRTLESNKLVNAASLTTLAGATLGKLSTFEVGMQLLAQQGTQTGYSARLGDQYLYTLIRLACGLNKTSS